MKENLFVGRESELFNLNQLLHKKSASLVVIKGRRRIGKSRLIEEFAKGKHFLRFEGLAVRKILLNSMLMHKIY